MLPCGIGAEGLNSAGIVPRRRLAVKSSSSRRLLRFSKRVFNHETHEKDGREKDKGIDYDRESHESTRMIAN